MGSNKKIDEAFEAALAEGVFPGAAVAVGTSKKILLQKSYGLAERIPVERKVTLKTYFDLASLTKPLCTTLIAMVLIEKGGLNLEDPVLKYFPRWKKDPYSQILIRHLLQHTSGLAAWRPYHEELLPKAIAGESREELRETLIKKILCSSLETIVGKVRVYSDLGFILLGAILEKATQKPLDKLFADLIARPLKLNNTFFIPVTKKNSFKRTDFASTSKCSVRRKILAAEVEDEHAWILGGVAGHAGLFSTLGDVIRITDEILSIDAGRSKLISKETFRRFINPRPALGWDTPAAEDSQAGDFFSKETIGHLGFTGCSIWIDLLKRCYVILLTNRVHPYRHNDKIKQFRPVIHNLLLNQFRLVR